MEHYQKSCSQLPLLSSTSDSHSQIQQAYRFSPLGTPFISSFQHPINQIHAHKSCHCTNITILPTNPTNQIGSLNSVGPCSASLYERPVNLEAAKKAHTEFRRTMRAAGLRVLTVRDILSFGVEDHMGARVELEELATLALNYEMAKGTKLEDLNEKVPPCPPCPQLPPLCVNRTSSVWSKSEKFDTKQSSHSQIHSLGADICKNEFLLS